MVNKKAKGSSYSRHGEITRPHRRPRVSYTRVFSHMFSGVGNRLYSLGTAIERGRRNVLRRIRKGTKRIFTAISRGFKLAGSLIAAQTNSIIHDLTYPFKKIGQSYRSLKSVVRASRSRGREYTRERVRLFFKYGWKFNKHLIGRFLNHVVPVIALTLCLVVITNMLRLNYALKVSYNGQTVGYIENEGVFESARKIIETRMIVGDDPIEWSDDTVLSVAVVPPAQLSSQDIMAESLLSASGSEIARATGIYIGGTLYGATTAPEVLNEKLEELKAPYEAIKAELGEDVVVKFARDVEVVERIFPASSILPVDELIQRIASDTQEDIFYTAKIGENASDIAMINGITVKQLGELNPGVSLDFTQSGAKLLVAQNEPLLRVKTVRQLVVTESVAYDTITTKDNKLTIQDHVITQRGVSGERTIVKEQEFDASGNIVLENIISNEVTTPPIDQHIIVGTQGVSSVGGAILCWPTGPGYVISRGWNATGASPHFGIDIAAPFGTSIFAAEGGTVTTAAYTSTGYGNYVIVTHADGMSTVYAHCSSLLVSEGQYVQRSELIALMGSTGNSTGNHLHFEVRLEGVRVPPEEWIY